MASTQVKWLLCACLCMSGHLQTLKYRFVFRLLWSPQVASSIRAVGNFYRLSCQPRAGHLIVALSVRSSVFSGEYVWILLKLEPFHTLMLLHWQFCMSVWSSLSCQIHVTAGVMWGQHMASSMHSITRSWSLLLSLLSLKIFISFTGIWCTTQFGKWCWRIVLFLFKKKKKNHTSETQQQKVQCTVWPSNQHLYTMCKINHIAIMHKTITYGLMMS